ncbi:hypothetical protein MIMGU_mgv1a024277mg, partial [Erythranthe guttata]
EKSSDCSSPDYDAWLQKDQMVMSLILNSMESHLAEILSYSESSLDPWEVVRDMYGNRNNSAKIFQIQQDIANIHQDDKPFVSLLGSLKSLCNELEIYRPLTIDPVILRKRIEVDWDFRSHILMNAELPSLKSVCNYSKGRNSSKSYVS